MERCWEELRRAGKALAEDRDEVRKAVNAAAVYFDLPQSPEAEAVGVFLHELSDALSVILPATLSLPEAAE